MSTEHQSSSSLALSAILLTFYIHFGAAQNSTVYIIPASAGGSPPVACPGEPCLTINQYVSNSSLRNGVTDVIMELQPGYHNLSIPFALWNMPTSIAMIGTGPDDVTLLCTEDFTFNFMNSVRVSGINLVNCGGPSTHINSVDNFILEDSTFQSDMPFHIRRAVGSLVIVNSVFSNCTSGVLLINDGGRPIIRNCTFSDNVNLRTRSESGFNAGVIDFMSVNAFIDQCTFKNNRATFTGGAIHLNWPGGLRVMNSSFFNNSVVLTDGGAIYSDGGSLTIEDSSFANNFGQNDGGAVAIIGEDNTLKIRRSEFTNNTAGGEGGAVLVFHNSSDTSRRQSTNIDDSRFVGNSAARGGAVMNRGSNVVFNAFQSSFINNTCSDDNFGSGAFYILSSKAKVAVYRATFTGNRGIDGAMGVIGSNYTVTVEKSSFVENIATRSGGAIVSSSKDVGNIMISDSEFNRNSAPQCGALDLSMNVDDMNPNIQTQGALTVRIFASNFSNNIATVGNGGALCASGISISISGTPVSTFRQNSAVTGGGAISTTNSVLMISEGSFFNNTALSGGDTINACSSNVTVDSSASNGLPSSVTDTSDCVDTMTTLSTTLSTTTSNFVSGGVSSYDNMINLMLFPFLTMILLVNNCY